MRKILIIFHFHEAAVISVIGLMGLVVAVHEVVSGRS